MSGWISSMHPAVPRALLYSAYKLLGAPLATKRKQARQGAGRTGVLPSCSPIMFKLDCSLSLSTIYLHSSRTKFYILINVISPPFLTQRNAAVDCVFVFTRGNARARARALSVTSLEYTCERTVLGSLRRHLSSLSNSRQKKNNYE